MEFVDEPMPADHSSVELRILLCGYGPLGLGILNGLLAQQELGRCRIVGVFPWSQRRLAGLPFGELNPEASETALVRQARMGSFPVLGCDGMNGYAFAASLAELKPHIVIVGSWGEILKKHLLNRPDILFINCHPSLLPKHRGANPYASVIREGESQTGVTYHRMVQAIDAGPILAQQVIALSEEDNGETVRERCAGLAQNMVAELVALLRASILDGQPLPEVPQKVDESGQLPGVHPAPKNGDGRIRWNDSVQAISGRLRSVYPWVTIYSYFGGLGTEYGWLKVCFKQFRLIEDKEGALSVGYPSGTVIGHPQKKLRLALGDVSSASQQEASSYIEVSDYRIAFGPFYLPASLSRFMGPLLLRPGKRMKDHGF